MEHTRQHNKDKKKDTQKKHRLETISKKKSLWGLNMFNGTSLILSSDVDQDTYGKQINTNRGSYMSAHVLLNVLNELRKRDKMRGLPSILSLFRDEFNKLNNTRARMLDSIYHMTLRLLWSLISDIKTL